MAYQVNNQNLLQWLLNNHPEQETLLGSLSAADKEKLSMRTAPGHQYDEDTWMDWADNQILHARQVEFDVQRLGRSVGKLEQEVARQDYEDFFGPEDPSGPLGPHEERLWEEHAQQVEPFRSERLEVQPGDPEWDAYLEAQQQRNREIEQRATQEIRAGGVVSSPNVQIPTAYDQGQRKSINDLRQIASQAGIDTQGMSARKIALEIEHARGQTPNAPAAQVTPIVQGTASPEQVQAAQERLGVATEQMAPQSPEGWEEMYRAGMEVGLTRTELRREIEPMYKSGDIGSQKDAIRYIQRKYLGGYAQARQAYLAPLSGTDKLKEAEAGFPKPHRWQRFPEHLRLRMQHSRPVSSLKTDEYGQPIIPEGHMRRGQEKHVFAEDVIRYGSFLGAQGEKTALTYDVGKLEKRIQMLGAHETVRMSGLRDAPEFLREGKMMSRPEQAQVAKMAMIIGGDVGGPGTMLVDPSVGRGTQREYREIHPKAGYSLGELAKTGDVFMPGSEMRLASGLAGRSTGKWRYTVQDVAELPGGGHGFVLERSATPEQLRGRSKFAGTKLEWSVQDLSGITDVEGKSLGIQMAGGLKDVQGGIYQWYKARGTDYLRETIQQYRATLSPAQRLKRRIFDRNVTLPETYQELGTEAMEAWMKVVAPQAVQTVRMSQTLTKENLEAYRKSGALDESTIQPVRGEPGVFTADVLHQAIVGEFATQTSHDYPVKRPFLSVEELDNLRRSRPQGAAEYERIMEYSASEREAYRSVYNAALASLGTHQPEPGTTRLSEMSGLAPLLAGASETVRGRLGLDADAELPYSAVAREFMTALAESEHGGSAISIGSQHGDLVLPSAQTMTRFGAGGEYENEEMGAYLRSAFDAITASAGGAAPDEVEKAVARARMEQETIAGGKEFQRKLEGAYLQRASGDVLRASMALKPGEVYIPDLDPGPVNVFGFPTHGPESHELIATNISRERAERLGVNTQEFTASMDVIQAMARDTDGDLAYAVERGLIDVGAGGKLIDTVSGQVLNNEQQILDAAKKRKKYGAGDVRAEMSGLTDFIKSPGEAVKRLGEKVTGVTMATKKDISQQIAYGSRLRGLIGQYYNVFRGGAATVPEHARDAYQTLFNISHERAQRPAPQVPSMARYHQLAKMNLLYKDEGGKLRRSGGAYHPEQGKMRYFASGLRGGEGLKEEALSAMLGMGDLLTGREFSQLMRPGRGKAALLEKAYKAYQTAGTPKEQRKARIRISEALGPWHEWGARSAVGANLVAPAVQRAYSLAQEEGHDLESFAKLADLTPEQATGFLEMRERQQMRISAHQRKPTEGVEGFLGKTKAFLSEGLGDWIARARGLSQGEIDERKSARAAEMQLLERKKQGVTAPPELFDENQAITDEMVPPEAQMPAEAEMPSPPPAPTPSEERFSVTWPGEEPQAYTRSELEAEIERRSAVPQESIDQAPAPVVAESAGAPPQEPPGGGPPPAVAAEPPTPSPSDSGGVDLQALVEALQPSGDGGERYERLVGSIFGVSSRDLGVKQRLLRENVGFWEQQVTPTLGSGETLSKEQMASTKQVASWARTVERGLRQSGQTYDLVAAGLLTEEQNKLLKQAEYQVEQSTFEHKAGFVNDPQGRAARRVRQWLSERISGGQGLSFREAVRAGRIGGLTGAEMGALSAHISDIQSPASRVGQVAPMLGAGYSKGAINRTVEEMYGRYPVGGQGQTDVVQLTQEHIKTLGTLNERLTDWEKAVRPALESGKDLSKAQVQLTQVMQRQMGDLPEILSAADSSGNQRLSDIAQNIAARGSVVETALDDISGKQSEQGWKRAVLRAGGGSRWDRLKASLMPEGGLGAGLRRAGKGMFSGWELMRLRRMWGMTGGAALGAIPAAAQEEQIALQAASVGMPMGQTKMGGLSLQMMESQARQQQFQLQMGRAAGKAWGWMPGMMADTGLGEVAGIAGPGIGLGLGAYWASSLLGIGAAGPLGLAAGGLATGAGLWNYLSTEGSTSANRAGNLAKAGEGELSLGLVSSGAGRYMLAESFNRMLGSPFNLGGPSEAEKRDILLAQQMRTGEMTGMSLDERAATIQHSYRHAPQWMEQGAAQQLATQWMRLTPGADNIRDIYQDPRFATMAARGMNPQQFSQMAQQWGSGPEDWQRFMDLSLGVSEQRFGSTMYTAEQWAPLRQLGMKGYDILKTATSPFETKGERSKLAEAASKLPNMFGMGNLFDKIEQGIKDAPIALERLENIDAERFSQVGSTVGRMRQLGFEPPETPETPTAEWVQEQYQQLPTYQAQLSLQQGLVGMGADQQAAVQAAQTFGSVGEVNRFQQFLSGDKNLYSILAQANAQSGIGPVSLGDGLGIPQQQLSGMTQQWSQALEPMIGQAGTKLVEQLVSEIDQPLIDMETGLKWGTLNAPGFTRFTGTGGSYGPAYRERMESNIVLPDLGIRESQIDQGLLQEYGELFERGGQRGLMAERRNLQMAQQAFQWNQRQDQITWQKVSQFGGTFAYDYPTGGSDQITTRGSFEIQKELRHLSRIWEDFSREFNDQMRDVQYGQFMENWQVKAERMPVKFGWMRDDLAFKGAQQTLQFGWQMEDMQEALRFATGRERRQILRKQERAAIQYGMGMGRIDEQGERIDTKEQWAKEDLEREKRHFLERFALQDEYQSRYERYIERRRELEDELQEVHEFGARFQIAQAEEQLAKQKELEEQMRAINAVMEIYNQQMENTSAQIAHIGQVINAMISGIGAEWTSMGEHARSEIRGIADEFSTLRLKGRHR